MSHNNDTPNQPTTGRSKSRDRYKPDLSRIPSLKDHVYPFQVSLNSYSPSAPPIFPCRAASQASGHLEPRQKQKTDMCFPSLVASSSSNPMLKRDSTSVIEGQASFQEPGEKATDPRHPFLIQHSPWLDPSRASILPMRGDVNPLIDLSSFSSASPLFPPVSLSEGECAILLNQAASQPSNHVEQEPNQKTEMPFPSLVVTSSSNPSPKRDFVSAFEGLDSSLQEPVEGEMIPQTPWFPDLPMDSHPNFQMQESLEHFDNSCQVPDLHAKGSYDAGSETLFWKDGEQNQINTILASLQDERRLREQAEKALEEERRLRELADQGREAAVRRVKELEGKLSSVVRKLERRHADNDYLVRANTRLQSDVKRAEEHARALENYTKALSK